jgi:HNH endonuclease
VRRRSSVDYLVDEQGCWIWQLSRNSKGYGVKWDREQRRLKLAHRWYYEREHGPIPDEWQVDHRCNVRACVRPDHLEAVSPEEHAQRTAAHRPRKPPRIREQPEFRQVDTAECIIWQGCLDRDGYGAKWVDGRRMFVHRWVYELAYGPIPPGMTIDHLCGNRACFYAEHLEAVSWAENNRRAKWRHSCKSGHPMTPENTIWESSGKRRCKTCRADSRERSEQRRKQRRRKERHRRDGPPPGPGRPNASV